MCSSNKGTGGMESSVVQFKPCIPLFACTHPSVSNSLDRNDWLAYKHQSTARVQTRLDCGSLLFTRISFHLVFQTCLDCGSLSAHTHQYPALCSNTFGLRVLCLCANISLQPFDQTRLECGSLFAYTHQFPALCFKHVWIMVPCLGTSICLLLPWSNTIGFWFLVVYMHQSSTRVSNTF